MNVNAIINRVVAEVLKVLAARIEHPRMGIVDGYDPTTHTARVRIQPEDMLTGWLPIHVRGVGQGWGIYFPPAPGDQVYVSHLEGDFGSGQITGSVNDDSHPPPSVPSREFWLIHQSGTSLKFTNDGKVALNGTAEIDIGNVGGTLHKLVTDAMVTFFNNHTHGSGPKPDQTMGDSQLTAILKAN